jgi:hypothetical protein
MIYPAGSIWNPIRKERAMDNLVYFLRHWFGREHECMFSADAFDNKPTPYGSAMLIFPCEHKGCRRTKIISGRVAQ